MIKWTGGMDFERRAHHFHDEDDNAIERLVENRTPAGTRSNNFFFFVVIA